MGTKNKKQISSFEAFKIMNEADIAKGTKLIGVCPDVISITGGQRGGRVTIGIPADELVNVISGKRMVIGLLIDKDEYFKLTKE